MGNASRAEPREDPTDVAAATMKREIQAMSSRSRVWSCTFWMPKTVAAKVDVFVVALGKEAVLEVVVTAVPAFWLAVEWAP